MKKLYVYIRICLYSIQSVFRIVIGSRIRHKNKTYTVSNGVIPDSWRLSELPYDNSWVKRKDCKLIVSLENIIHNYKSTFSFYKGYWFSIWVDNPKEIKRY